MRRPVYRLLAALGSLPLAAVLLVSVTQPASADSTTTFTPTDDTYVRADVPDANFGLSTSLKAKSSPTYNAYLKFTVSGLTEPVSRATLRLFSRSTGSTVVKAFAVPDTTWSEYSVTYPTAPVMGRQVGQTGPLTAGTWAEIDLTSTVLGNGTYAFGLTAGATAARVFDSKEGANPPQLVIDTSNDPVVVAAGDVACATDDPSYNGGTGTATACHQSATASLIGQINPAALFMLGDGQYNSGSVASYTASYGPSWGQFMAITKPTVGNHDYGQSGAAGYFTYFGDTATPLQPGCRKGCNGWFSFDIGSWHIIDLNTECTRFNGGAGCAAGSPEELWLKADLAAHPALCTMVITHRPRWSSNSFATPEVAPFVDDMYAAGVDLYLTGHAHSYERFAPQNPAGQRDDAAGIREFVIGTGGESFSGFGTAAPNSQVRKTKVFGVMRFTLHPGSYDWSFVADPSTPFSDSGSGTCH